MTPFSNHSDSKFVRLPFNYSNIRGFTLYFVNIWINFPNNVRHLAKNASIEACPIKKLTLFYVIMRDD